MRKHFHTFEAMAALLVLSTGVGATTAAFSLVNRFASHGAKHVECETLVTLATERVPSLDFDVRGPSVRGVAYESAGDDGLSAEELAVDVEDLAGSRGAVLAAAGAALALLVACARSASRLLDAVALPAAVIAVTLGAITSASFVLRMLSVARLDARSAAFALCVALLAVSFARIAARDAGVPLG